MKHKIQILLLVFFVAVAGVAVFVLQKEKKNSCNCKNCESYGGGELYDITNFKTGEIYFIK